VYDDLEKDFPMDPEAWDLRARRLTDHAPAQPSTSATGPEEAAVATYQRALEATEGPEMYDRYLAFLTEQLNKEVPLEGGNGGVLPKLKGRPKQLAKAVLEVSRVYPSAIAGHIDTPSRTQETFISAAEEYSTRAQSS